MDKNSLFSKVKEYGLNTKEAYMAEAFSRNIGLLTLEEQEKLSNATVAIPGMGGVGGAHFITMVRSGVSRFHISDFDTYEPANINRQFGAHVPDFGRPKMEVMKELALSINPYIEIKEFPEGINSENVDDFLDGVQVVLDSLDFFCFDIRRLIFTHARKNGVYVITAGPMGFSSAMLIFSPHKGMSFDEYFNIVDGMPSPDKYLSFALGLTPRPTHIKYMDLSKVDLDSKAGPSLNIACQICTGMAGTEAVRIILNKGGIKPVPHYFQFDPFLQKYRKGKLYFGNRNPIQRLKMKAVKILLRINKVKYKPLIPEFPLVKITPDHLPEEVIRHIIMAGIQAPSGDNVQPWKFSYQGNTVQLHLDRDADHSFFNVNQIASIISCGAVLENMRITAAAFGLESKIEYLPSSGKNDLIASVEFIQGQAPGDSLSHVIWKRHTNRKFFKKDPLSPSIFQDLQDAISGFPGARLHFITDKPVLKKLGKMIYRVDRIRTEHRSLHEHLCSMIRYTHEEALERRDGFPLKNLEAGLAGEAFLKVTRPWRVMHFVNLIGLGRMVALHSYQSVLYASGAALLTVDGMETEDFFKGGRALERIWLTISKNGYFLQPMAAVTLFWSRWQVEGEEGFLKKHRSLLRNVWEGYRLLFPDVDFGKEGHVMMFRFGSGKDIKYGTYRKDIDNFLLKD